jgi:Integrase core domain
VAPASASGASSATRGPRRTDAAGVRRKVIGWEYAHVAIDDATRLAYAEVLPDERAQTAVGFLRRAAASCAATASRPSG